MTSTPEAEIHALSELTEGSQASVPFSVTPEDMRDFARISGDYNPLHSDEAFARSKGFDGIAVYGALIIAKISQVIGMRLPGRDSIWSSMAMEFKKPLMVGQQAHVKAVVSALSEATGMIELKITVHAGEVLLAKGKTEVLLVQS